MVGACLSCITLPSLALAVPSPQVRNGDSCKNLNQVVDNGLFEFKCMKKGSQKIYRRIGPLQPQGKLFIYPSYKYCHSLKTSTTPCLGQSFTVGNCSDWLLRVRNDSNILIESMYFNPVKGHYWFYPSAARMPDVQTDAIPQRIFLDLAPYVEKEIKFQTCTTRQNPVQGYEYYADEPSHISWNWANKLSGILCFAC